MKMNEIPGLEQISQYLEQMQFKTQLIGGVNQENVLEHFEAVNKMYQDIFLNLQKSNEKQQKQIEQLLKESAEEKVAKQELQTQLKTLQDEFRYFKETDSISGKKEEMYQIYDEYKGKIISAIQSLKKEP
ncbi:MAG: hypothetical protein PHQ72_06880 [Hespellia sp.]|nr:hypothetical protein [Hespellia sp.]